MAACTRVMLLLVLVQALSFAHGHTGTLPRTIVPNLRETYGKGAMGRFLVDRKFMEETVMTRTGDASIVLAPTPMKPEYDTNKYTELLVFIGDLADITLQGGSSGDWWSPLVSSRGTTLMVLLPVMSNGYQFNFVLNYLTDAPGPLMVPFVTNYNAIRYIDSIEYLYNHMLFLEDGDDYMVVFIDHPDDHVCKDDYTTGHDFDEALGGHLHFTNYPMDFDWGCDIYDFEFCQSADYLKYRQELLGAGGNVCTTMETGFSKRCSAEITLLDMKGKFRSEMPYLTADSPTLSVAIEAEWVERRHTVGLVFPCIV